MKLIENGPSPLVFAHAKSFYRATKAIPKREISPYLVTACFTIELLLKSMKVRFMYEHSSTDGIMYKCDSLIRDGKHDLVALYAALPPEYIQELEARYRTRFSQSLKVELEKYRTAFVERRYEYEHLHKGIKIETVDQLLDIIYTYAREIIGDRYLDEDDFET